MVSLTSSSPVPNSKHPILIICEQRLVGEGVKLLVNAQPDMEVVREVQQYSEAIPLLQACQPEVVIFVPGEPRCSQTDVSAQIPEIVSRLKNAYAKAKVFVLAAARDVGSVRQFLKAGASGCLLTSAPTQALFQAIRTLAGGGVYLDDDLIDTLFFAACPRPIGHLVTRSGLIAREEEVLRFVACGLQRARNCRAVKNWYQDG
ncbi:MAG: response regulator transcription factor [Acidobacteriota bacterium]